MSKWIQIWYSWGDMESPVEVPASEDAWDYMKQIVAKEMFVAQEEHPYGCTLYAYADEGKVALKYHRDGEWCYYLITDEESFNPWGNEHSTNRRKATSIIWDVDSEEELASLPTEIDIPEDVEDDEVSDYLSMVTGWCHKGYFLEHPARL